MISRPITVPAERSADLNAELCTTCSTMPGSSFSGLGEGGSAGGGAWVEGGAGCSCGVGACSSRARSSS